MAIRKHTVTPRKAETCTTPLSNDDWRDNPNEVWRIIPSWPDYAASSWGRIRRETPGLRTWPGRVLNIGMPKVGGKGRYPGVGVVRDGKTVKLYVHRLVAEAFYGPAIPPHDHVDHLDSNPCNNRIENLDYCSAAEDARRRVERNRVQKGDGHYMNRKPELRRTGSKNGQAKISEAVALQVIRALEADPDANCRAIARSLGISHHIVYHIKHGNRWTHLSSK